VTPPALYCTLCTSCASQDNGLTLASICPAQQWRDLPRFTLLHTEARFYACTFCSVLYALYCTIQDNGLTLASICFANGGAAAVWDRSLAGSQPHAPVSVSSGDAGVSLGDQETWPALTAHDQVSFLPYFLLHWSSRKQDVLHPTSVCVVSFFYVGVER
jgi:hypothetical protein